MLAAGNGHGDVSAGGIALTALASLPLALHRRAPLAVFVVTALASAAVRLLAEPAGPPLGPTVAPLLRRAGGADAAHAHGRRGSARAPCRRLGAVQRHIPGDPGRGRTGRLGRRVGGGRPRPAAAGADAAMRRGSAARLAAAEERTRIARDLHDSAGHAMNVILVHAGLGRVQASATDAAREAFTTIEDVARQTVADIDQIVGALRGQEEPGVEPPPGLAALETLLERHRRAGLDVTTTIEGEPRAAAPRRRPRRVPDPAGGADQQRPPWRAAPRASRSRSAATRST